MASHESAAAPLTSSDRLNTFMAVVHRNLYDITKQELDKSVVAARRRGALNSLSRHWASFRIAIRTQALEGKENGISIHQGGKTDQEVNNRVLKCAYPSESIPSLDIQGRGCQNWSSTMLEPYSVKRPGRHLIGSTGKRFGRRTSSTSFRPGSFWFAGETTIKYLIGCVDWCFPRY